MGGTRARRDTLATQWGNRVVNYGFLIGPLAPGRSRHPAALDRCARAFSFGLGGACVGSFVLVGGCGSGNAEQNSDGGAAGVSSSGSTSKGSSSAATSSHAGSSSKTGAGTNSDAGASTVGDASTASGDAGSSHPDAAVGTDSGGTTSASCSGTTHSTGTAASNLPAPPAVTIPSNFKIETVASVGQARELAALPNGDLLVATSGQEIVLVPNADSAGAPDAPVTFATINDAPVQGVAFDPASCTVFAASTSGVYAMAYADGQTTATAGSPIARVRQGAISPNRPAGDTDLHTTSSVAFAGGKLYVGVGSSCNACAEVDATRASIQVMAPDGANMTTRATRIRNAIALATNPATGTLWAGGAGQDDLSAGHPYEFFDAVTSHSGIADYGWPVCEEDHVAYTNGASCSATVEPLIELPAYSTIIGASFYPTASSGTYAFPSMYRGGVFLSAHGSWHTNAMGYASAPIVVFVPMTGDAPQMAVNWAMTVDWSDSAKQWTDFVSGYQESDGMTRIGRPTGIAVGPQGSLFVADDQNGAVYRIRPK